MRTLLLLLPTAFLSTAQSAPPSALTKLLDAELSRFPAKTGVYVKHLTTGEEAGVRADEGIQQRQRHQTRHHGARLPDGGCWRAEAE